MFLSSVLWMNSRNLSFIKKYNNKEAIDIADNKLKTKKYLSKIWVPFAQTFAIIRNYEELKKFSFDSIVSSQFVIKPNKGSKGKWILIIEKREGVYLHNGTEYSVVELQWHMQDILDGAYSISWFDDSILIEERLLPHHDFQDFCTYWLADIRIIVFNFVPVAAMVRVPTLESDGKANLNQWWIWMWIDVGTWKVSTIQYKRKIYTNTFPDRYSEFYLKQIPFWDKIIQYSSQIQGYIDLWYLALDWVITQDWPKLLEINARAWLEIQNVTWIPLKSRLARIKDIKILDFNKWISIAKSLFSKENHAIIDNSNTLYLSQLWSIKYIEDRKTKYMPITLKVDTHIYDSMISSDLVDIFNKRKTELHVDGSTISFVIKKPKVIEKLSIRNEVILWTRDIQNYIIKPVHKYQTIEKYFSELLFGNVKDVDYKINEIWKKLNISYYLKPSNSLEEKKKFIHLKWEYNPIFEYYFPNIVDLDAIEKQLLHIQQELKSADFNKKISMLFDEKITELFCKLSLLKGYIEQDFTKIDKYQKRLYWEVNQELLAISEKKIDLQKTLPKKSELLWRLLTEEEIIIKIKEKIVMYGLPDTEIIIKEDNSARISITTWKFARIQLKKWVQMYEKELDAVLAHEIWVHLRRFVNGMKSWLRILKHGTGFYLEDEEWVAIYNSLRYLPENYEKNDMYIKYYLVEHAHNYTFEKLAQLISTIYPEKSLDSIFTDCLRLKKWIIDTWACWVRWMSYDKDKIYLSGYYKVKKWVESWGYLENLYVGKVKIKDIENFTQ